jgi:hypothetical protein
MIKLNNWISKLFYKNTDNSFFILIYIDVDEELTDEFIKNYINKIMSKNDILKKTIVEKNNSIFLDDVKSYNINEYIQIKHTQFKHFDSYIYNLLNTNFDKDLKWESLWCIDKETKQTRFYFKIHHSYVDGYKLINILMSPFKTTDTDITKKFQRDTNIFNKIYYFLIGTIHLIITNLIIIIKLLFNFNIYDFFNENDDKKNKKSDIIICKALNFNEIKLFTIKQNITINDFLYALMIRADKLFRCEEKNLVISSPINISGIKQQTNNFCFVLNSISNSYDNKTLFKKVNTTFNYFKYSLFIPILNFIVNNVFYFVNINSLLRTYNDICNNFDYVYSNIIGPNTKDFNIKIADMHFIIAPKNKEIVYNIVSSNEENINIICSFKKGTIKNKKLFKKCIYKAFKDLIMTS